MATTKSRFDAATVTALRMLDGARRVEIEFADAAGVAHVVSLPVAAAADLAKLLADASGFIVQLRQGPKA